MNVLVITVFLAGLVASQVAEQKETTTVEFKDVTTESLSVVEEPKELDAEKSQQKRELYEDEDEEEREEIFLEKESLVRRNPRFQYEGDKVRSPLYYKEMPAVLEKKVILPYKVPLSVPKPFAVEKPYYYLEKSYPMKFHENAYPVEVPVPYPVPVPVKTHRPYKQEEQVSDEEFEKQHYRPDYYMKFYDVQGGKYQEEPLGEKYRKVVSTLYGEYSPYMDLPRNGESEHVLPGYLYHHHMKHQGVGELYGNGKSEFVYGSGYSGKKLDTEDEFFQRRLGELNRGTQYVPYGFRGQMQNVELRGESQFEENPRFRRPLNSGFRQQVFQSSQFPVNQGAPRFFRSDETKRAQLCDPKVQPLFPAGEVMYKTEQEIKQHLLTPKVDAKLHHTLAALEKAEQEKEAIGHKLIHVQYESDSKIQHGLQALQKANQEKHIIEQAVHHNIMQKENNDVKLHQSLTALQLAEHQKQAIEHELQHTQKEKEAKVHQELAALEKAEQEKQKIAQQLRQMAEHKSEPEVAALKGEQHAAQHKVEVVKRQETLVSRPLSQVAVSAETHHVSSTIPQAAVHEHLPEKDEKEVVKKDALKEDSTKKQELAAMLKQSSLVIGAIKEKQVKDEALKIKVTPKKA